MALIVMIMASWKLNPVLFRVIRAYRERATQSVRGIQRIFGVVPANNERGYGVITGVSGVNIN